MKSQAKFYYLLLGSIMLTGTVLSLVWAVLSSRYERDYRLVTDQHIKTYEEIPVLVSNDN